MPDGVVHPSCSPDRLPPGFVEDLCAAVRGADLDLAFQPEYDLGSAAITAVEALVRWRHPVHGDVDPEVFVAVAEQRGLIRDLGDWVLRAALADFTTWCAAVPALDVTLRVNVSLAQLAAPYYATNLDAALARFRVDPRRVCLEITERTPRPTLDATTRSVRAVRALGVKVAIDDLGSGYSNLGLLRALPVDIVKLDRSLVAGLDSDPRALAIVESLVRLAATLQLTLVAEGIETQQECEALTRLGCRRGQGFLLSGPLSAAEVAPRLAERGRRRPRPAH